MSFITITIDWYPLRKWIATNYFNLFLRAKSYKAYVLFCSLPSGDMSEQVIPKSYKDYMKMEFWKLEASYRIYVQQIKQRTLKKSFIFKSIKNN